MLAARAGPYICRSDLAHIPPESRLYLAYTSPVPRLYLDRISMLPACAARAFASALRVLNETTLAPLAGFHQAAYEQARNHT